jgi:hypothetical protein
MSDSGLGKRRGLPHAREWVKRWWSLAGKGRIMDFTLDNQEAQVLADAIKTRLDQLGASIAKADSRRFRDEVVAEGDVLERIYRRLGCEHPEWNEVKACDVPPEPATPADETTAILLVEAE